jgi:hypothetical protein
LFNEESTEADVKNTESNCPTDIENADTVVDIPRNLTAKTLGDTQRHNVQNTNGLLKHYSVANSGLEVITEKVRTSITNKQQSQSYVQKKENLKSSKNQDQEMSFSLNTQKKNKPRGSIVNNRKTLNTTFDLLNDSPNSIEVRRPPKPYPFAKSSVSYSISKIDNSKYAVVIQRAWKKYKSKQASKKHKRQGSKIPQINRKRVNSSNATSRRSKISKPQYLMTSRNHLAESATPTDNRIFKKQVRHQAPATDRSHAVINQSAIPSVVDTQR